MFLYYAVVGLPVDYEKAAQHYSNDYRSTADAFRKKDLLDALRPRIDMEVEKSKQHRYFTLEGQVYLGHYDFSSKGFPINNLVTGSAYAYFYDNAEYKYSYTNGDTFKLLKVSDESVARRIEDLVQHGTPLVLRVYAFAQDADPSSEVVKSEIVKVRLLDPRGVELAAE